MKEPVYECQRCGATLERHQQGKVTWCLTCQVTWDMGFNDGMRAYRALMDKVSSPGDLAKAVEQLAPFIVRDENE